MKSLHVAVTGAGGYLGRGIVRDLLEKNVTVSAVGLNLKDVDSRARKIEANIFSLENPFERLGEPDVLLHLAWRDGFVHQSEAHLKDLPKHVEFLTKLVNSGIKQIAIMGSMHETGFHEGSVDENTSCNPTTYYGIAKNALRQASEVLTTNNGVKWQWLRGFYIAGNSGIGNSIFAKILQADKVHDKYFPFTTGRNQFDFIDYPEFCDQVSAAVTQNQILGVINICSGWPESLDSRMQRFIIDNKLSIKLKYGAFPDRAGESKAIWGDNTKITQIMRNR